MIKKQIYIDNIDLMVKCFLSQVFQFLAIFIVKKAPNFQKSSKNPIFKIPFLSVSNLIFVYFLSVYIDMIIFYETLFQL